MKSPMDRREFLKTAAAGTGALCLGPGAVQAAPAPAAASREYRGPNVIVVRFGGGVRRLETIDPQHSFAPFLRHELAPRGTLYTDMRIVTAEGVNTGHGEGTLNLLTGRYDRYRDIGGKFLASRYEARVPTLFEYLRKQFDVADHETLLVNGEDRTDEEFYSFSNHHLFGVNYRCSVLSLYRFKTYLLRRQLAAGSLGERERRDKQAALAKLEAIDYRHLNIEGQGPAIEGFWEEWRRLYGESGLVNPRGDELLTELAQRALRRLRPRLIMVNYQDPDYVHWGNLGHYTRAVAIIDRGLRTLVETVEADPAYRGNTVFVVVPDCGRDSNRFMAVPCQHHFNSKSSHEIFALFVGPGVRAGRIVPKEVQQIAVAPTVGALMGMRTEFAEGRALEDAIA